jgi:hypothetical protein
MQDYGRIAYEAYADNRAWRTFDGRDMLAWDELGEDIRVGWRCAGQAGGKASLDCLYSHGLKAVTEMLGK